MNFKDDITIKEIAMIPIQHTSVKYTIQGVKVSTVWEVCEPYLGCQTKDRNVPSWLTFTVSRQTRACHSQIPNLYERTKYREKTIILIQISIGNHEAKQYPTGPFIHV